MKNELKCPHNLYLTFHNIREAMVKPTNLMICLTLHFLGTYDPGYEGYQEFLVIVIFLQYVCLCDL